MIQTIVKSIFEVDLDILVHQANCFCTMNSGLAKEIKQRYPEAASVDSLTRKGDMTKLGSYTVAKISGGAPVRFVVNLYSQHGYNSDTFIRKTDYNAMVQALTLLRDNMTADRAQFRNPDVIIGFPWKMGCGLGGGDWRVVEAIIRSVFEESDFTVLILQRPEDA